MVECPHWERAARWAPPAGAGESSRAPHNSARAAPPLCQSLGNSPSGHTAASGEGADVDGAVRPPRTPLAVGPSSRRKALWEGGASFLASARVEGVLS